MDYPRPGSEGGEPELVPASQEDNLAEGEQWQPQWAADVATFASAIPYRLAKLVRTAKNWRRRAPAESEVTFIGSESLADDALTAYPTMDAETAVVSEPADPGQVTPSRRRRRRQRAAAGHETAALSAEATVLDKVRAKFHLSGQVQRPIEFILIVATAIGAGAAVVYLATGIGVLATLGLVGFILLLVAVGLWHTMRSPHNDR